MVGQILTEGRQRGSEGKQQDGSTERDNHL
jgi:hypothetical protein